MLRVGHTGQGSGVAKVEFAHSTKWQTGAAGDAVGSACVRPRSLGTKEPGVPPPSLPHTHTAARKAAEVSRRFSYCISSSPPRAVRMKLVI